jgi:hypothetical protein
MRPDEVHLAIDWAAGEGWNPGLHDANAYLATDPEGFFVGLIDGEPVASISAVSYGEAFAFVGFYIVRPELRGRGYGLRLWQYALGEIHAANIGLDGVLAQVSNYEKSGFESAYHNQRFAGSGTGVALTDAGLVPLADVPFETLLAYDAALFPAPRPSFLRAWSALPQSNALALLDGDALRGYGVIRRCHTGFRIGPLFADDEAVAEQLYRGLTGAADAGAPVYMDIPDTNPAGLRLAERHALTPGFETARMYTNGLPDIDVNRVFGVTTLELG